MSDKGLQGLLREWRDVAALPSSAQWSDSKRKAADELATFLERLEADARWMRDMALSWEPQDHGRANAYNICAERLRSILYGEPPIQGEGNGQRPDGEWTAS